MHAFIEDIRLYRRLIVMQMRTQMQYKMNLCLEIITFFCMTTLEFCALLLYFVSFPTLLGWQIGEVAMLATIMSISFGLSELVGAGIDGFASSVRQGDFDRILLRPISAFTQVIGSDFRLRRLGRVTQGFIGLFVALHFLPAFVWTADKLLVLGIGLLSGAIIFMSISLLGATICFWTIETTELTNILSYGSREMLSYPITIYNWTLQCFFLFVVPMAFGSYVPTCYILGRALPFGLPTPLAFVSPIVALLFALLAGIAWHFGVLHYQSTGS